MTLYHATPAVSDEDVLDLVSDVERIARAAETWSVRPYRNGHHWSKDEWRGHAREAEDVLKEAIAKLEEMTKILGGTP